MLGALCLTLFFMFCIGCSSNAKSTDAVSGATNVMPHSDESAYTASSNILIILFSPANSSTGKISNAIAGVLDAQIQSPEQIDGNDLHKYDLIGFGSGIFDQKHHASLLELADTLPFLPDKKAFIFSTSGIARSSLLNDKGEPKKKNKNFSDPHTPLRERLLSKGFDIIGEFNCVGFNDNSFLKLFGGMNKGRPNENDLRDAEIFAEELLKNE